MLERLAAWVLNSYIGEYFGNVNTDQLSVAIQKGEVELEGLPLKVDALKHWGLPINVKAGYIGKIRLKIPVYRIRSEPCLILVEELYLVAHPITDFTYHEDVEKKIMQDYKMNLLDSLELKFQSAYESMSEANYYQSSYSSWLSATTSFVTNIVENLQLKIKSVHIRYENLSNSLKAQFACGLVIKNLSIQSTDEEWNPKFVYRETASDMRKLVNLDDFNIYWDNNAVFVGDYSTPEFVSAMRTLMVTSITKDNLLDNHDFILTSVTGQAKMKKNCSEKPLRSCNEPRLTFDLQLESFPLSLNIIQYRQLMDWIEISSRNNRIWKHRKFRPTCLIKDKPAEWWKYGINVHMTNYRTKNERLKWEFILKRANDIKDYFNAYYNYLLHPESLNSATKQIKERIEYELSFDELCCLRDLVYDKIKRNKEDVRIESKNKEVSSWYQNWFSGWYSEQVPNTDLQPPSTQMKRDISESFDIETEIQKSLFELEEEFVNIFDTIENDTFLKRDAVFAQINLVIQNASFTLLSSFTDLKQNFSQLSKPLSNNGNRKDELRPILEIEFRSVEVGVEARPRYCSHEFKIKLGELYIKDTLSEEAVRSNRRYLMSSEFDDLLDTSNHNTAQFKTDFVSTSCPSIPTEFNMTNLENYASLPSKLHNQSIFQMLPKRKKKISKIVQQNLVVKKVLYQSESCPTTPVLTPKRGFLSKKEDLVKITLLFIDKSSPLFEKKFGGINRFVNIEFNRLETNVIIDTWSVIMNFFSSATEHSVLVESLDLNKSDALDEALGKDWSNSKIDITVNELSLVLFKSESEQLAKIGISNFNCYSTTTNGNTSAEGSLGKVTVIDLTLSGKVYKERFLTAGAEALSFNFFKHCGKNLESKTDFDMKLDCTMSLVQYVHSQRFFMELLNFWHLFNSMDSLSNSNLNSNNLINNKIQTHQQAHLPGSPKKPKRGSRLSLNINADAPVIIIPINSLCDHVLVADFGKLEVRNRFAYAGSQNTISTVCKKSGLVHSDLTRNFKKPTGVVTRTMTSDILNKLAVVKSPTLCLLDVINLSLTEMDLYKGVLVNLNESEKASSKHKSKNKDTLYFPSFKIKRLPGKILKERFKLKLQLERNLDAEFSRSVPDISMKGTFSTVHCTLNPSTYQLIRGIIEHNLGEPINHLKQVKPIIIGREGLNVVLSNHIWTSMATHLELNNVTVEIVNNAEVVDENEQKLARIDFVSSNLSIESFTDSSKDIDLVSQEIRVIDTRYEHLDKSSRPSIFLNILQPKTNKSKNSNKNPLQIEIHYRSKPDLACLTVLLNNMRIMGIFDWFKAISDFLMQTFNFETMATFNSEVASHFQQLLEYQSLHCPCFELRLNVMDTELVVVEDCSQENTHAVILRGTSVLNLTTDDNVGEPFNCSLERLEVFSCVMGNELEHTSLSIVDPLNITISLISKTISSFQKRDDIDCEHILIIDTVSVNTRLSFNDITLILKILNSLPKQTESFTKHNKSILLPTNTASADLDNSVFALPSHVNQLQSLGFDRQDCGLALEACQGNINDAAIWLAQNSKVLSRLDSPDYNQHAFQFVKVGRFHKLFTNHLNIQIQNGNFTLIDDCKDIDVPLFEVKLSKFSSLAKFERRQMQIECKYTLTCDYYNRALSGWEPFIEPWLNKVQIKLQKEPSRKTVISFTSDRTLNFVITNTFLNLYKSVYQTWSDEYQKLCNEGHYKLLRKRSPFIPFALKNETGCVLNFSLLAYTENYANQSRQSKHIIGTSIDKVKISKMITYGGLELDLIEVDPDKTVPFSFEAPTKIRHQDSHMPRSHKIIVQVDGWYEVFPVSVDKVGVYFREAKPKDIRLETSRIVFDITLEPNAVKLITVRSALIVHNQLNTPIELSFNTVTKNVLIVESENSIPVPLKLVRSMIYVKPCNVGANTSRSFVEWENIKKQGESNSQLFQCISATSHKSKEPTVNYSLPYYFCVHTIRDNFPLDNCQNSVGMVTARTLPGHHIYLLAPLEIVNLLPLELKYYLQNLPFGGNVKPGESSLQYINTQTDFTINFLMDNYTKSNSLLIKPGASKDFFMHLEMYDKKGKLLLLQAQICLVTNSALGLKILISAPYWFVNKTGLPLVFKQEGTDQEAGGQFEEHEIARCILPLLFSFYDADASLTCIMRLGRSLGKSKWSVGFYLEKGIRVRRVRIASDDPRKPDKVYEVGIEVQNGKGRYKDTKIVTFSPRYLIENLSSFRLQIAQKYTILNVQAAQTTDSHISVLPNSNMAFHWPRTDQDKLLCVKIVSSTNDSEQYHWSGGFEMIPNSSFHLNVRDLNGKCTFLRVEILQTGATIFIVVQNAFNLPPPIRIDNYSEVQIEFYQTGTLSLWNKSVVRPKSSFNYAWDEFTMKPHLTVCAPGGSSSIYDLTSLRPGNNLTYENFIYIAFTGTFIAVDATELNVKQNENIHNMQLVLEVCEGSNTVILNRKEPGRRSQLWRMDSSGRLLHEGSSPPLDPRKSQQANISINENALVLDISSQYCKPGEYTALMLRKINTKRSYTQTWHFTTDGRLKCEFDDMYVQPQNGFLGLKKGNIAVLGPTQPVSYLKLEGGIQFEQAICTQKMRKGSGILTVQVLSDGPTRVLQILDVRNMPPYGSTLSSLSNRDELLQLKRYSLSQANTPKKEPKDLTSDHDATCKLAAAVQKINQEYQLYINTAGIGVSIVNRSNEELVYVYMENVIVDYCNKINEHFFNCSVRYIQTDNQLIDAEKSIVFYTMDLEDSNPNAHLPAISVCAHKLVSPNLEAHFFEQVQIKIKDVILNIEEQLLLKLYDFFGYGQVEKELELIKGEIETKNMHVGMTSSLNKCSRIYFSLLEIELNKIRLSVFTSSHFSNDLLEIKKRTGLRLMRFEDAKIFLEPFRKTYSLETCAFLVDAIINHYRKELKGQAAKILGSVDFLGNPLGFMNDVTDGITELIDGNIGGLFVNISHGISDSTAKFTSVLSDSLGAVTLDSRHQEIRKRIKQESSNGPIKAGFIGLGIGLLGGLTSIVTQTYEGAVQQGGVQGVVTGFGKGVLGTFTKPAVGVLDLATSAASMMRDRSRKISTTTGSQSLTRGLLENRIRMPRQSFDVCGQGTLLPEYNNEQAAGQDFFYKSSLLFDKDEDEVFASFKNTFGNEYSVLITSDRVRFLFCDDKKNLRKRGIRAQITVDLMNLVRADTLSISVVESGLINHYLQLTVKDESHINRYGYYANVFYELKSKKPSIRCTNDTICNETMQQINHAKSYYDERKYTLTPIIKTN